MKYFLKKKFKVPEITVVVDKIANEYCLSTKSLILFIIKYKITLSKVYKAIKKAK